MAEHRLTALSALGGVDIAVGENRIVERRDLGVVSVAIAQGAEEELTHALEKSWSLSMPEPMLSKLAGERRTVLAAPDQILILSEPPSILEATDVRREIGDCGYTTEQTDAWAALEISGPNTLAALERICSLDLDSSVFPVDGAARTRMEHLGVWIIRVGKDRFLLMSSSSSARSFLHAIKLSFENVVS